MTRVLKHYQDVSSNVGQLKVTDSNTCVHYALFFLFARARGKSMESFIQPFKYLRDVDNDRKIVEKLRKTTLVKTIFSEIHVWKSNKVFQFQASSSETKE